MKKKNKKDKNKYRYGNDIIAYYGKKKKEEQVYGYYYLPIDTVDPQEIHNIAVEIFGQSFYIDYNSLIKERIFEPEILLGKEKR